MFPRSRGACKQFQKRIQISQSLDQCVTINAKMSAKRDTSCSFNVVASNYCSTTEESSTTQSVFKGTQSESRASIFRKLVACVAVGML